MKRNQFGLTLLLLTAVALFLACFSPEASAWHRHRRSCLNVYRSCPNYCYPGAEASSICPEAADTCFFEYAGPQGFYGTSEYYIVGETKDLFNGKDLTGWTNAEGKGPGKNWKVENGTIFREKNGGDLYTVNEYENFILEFEVKVAPGGNSGLKYHSWSKSGWGMGFEFQAYDCDPKKTAPYHQSGSLYEMYEPMTPPELFKKNEFNKCKIVSMGNYLEHWINGQRAVSCEVGSPDWLQRKAKSKFAEEANFGTTAKGRIMLQDHNDQVWFKNIKLTVLTKSECEY